MGRKKKRKGETSNQAQTPRSRARPSPPPEPPRETVRLVGVVRSWGGDEAPFGWFELTASGGGPLVRDEREGRFELVIGDGHAVEVDASGALVHAVTPSTLKGRWEEIAAEPLALLAREHAPGPHEKVKLQGVVIAPGDRVAIFGEITRFDTVADTGGMRTAPERRVGAVTAEIVAAGPDTERALDEAYAQLHPPPKAPSRLRPYAWLRWGMPVLAALTIAPWLALFFAPLSRALALEVLSSSLFFAAHYAIGRWALARWPSFHRPGDPEGFGVTSASADEVLAFMGPSSLGWFVPMILVMRLLPGAPGEPPRNACQLIAITTGAYVLFTAVWVWLRSRRTAREVRVLLDAPPLPDAPAQGAWGSVAGRVLDPTPVPSFVQPTALAHLSDITYDEGSGPHGVERRILGEDGFLVDTGSRTIAIHPKGATWGTTVRELGDPRAEKRDEKASKRKRFEVDRIPIGGRILVAGRVKAQRKGEQPSLAATGPGSLVMFATGADEEPRAILKQAGEDRRWVVIALFLMALIPLILVTVLWGELPPVYLGPSED